MSNSVEVLAGDFELGSAHQAIGGEFHLKPEGRGAKEKIPYSDIEELEVATEESVKKLGGTIGWGLAGGAVFGPVGLLAGLLAGGKGQETVFICKLVGGRKFIARTKTKVFSEIQAGYLFKDDNKKVIKKYAKDQKAGLIGCLLFMMFLLAIFILPQHLPGWIADLKNLTSNLITTTQSSSLQDAPTAELLSATRALPASDFEGNLRGYRELAGRDPGNELYKQKVIHYEAKQREGKQHRGTSKNDNHKNLVSTQLTPETIISNWNKLGIAAEIPWRKSKFPNKNYTYISQCRGYVGPTGPSGFETEITCELLGNHASAANQVLIGVELWNPQVSNEARRLALKAIDAIGVVVPAEVIEAFNRGQNKKAGAWEVVDESTDKLKEIRVYYMPAGGEH